jgi:uncharacterized membrane protein required for colicin V production
MYIDLLLLFLILMFGVLGYIHGFVRQVLSLLALLSIIFFSHPLASWLKESSGWTWFSRAPLIVDWGLSSLFLITLFLVAGGIITIMQKEAGLEPTDRWLGAVLGGVKGFVIALCLGLAFYVLPEKLQARFPDIDKDAANSYFMKGSAEMLEWKSISSFRSLQQIRAEFKNMSPGNNRVGISKEGPWALDLNPEKD